MSDGTSISSNSNSTVCGVSFARSTSPPPHLPASDSAVLEAVSANKSPELGQASNLDLKPSGSQSILTNGHAHHNLPIPTNQSVAKDNPPKRGPGRPRRSDIATAAPEKPSSDLNTRPRRTLRAVSSSPTSGISAEAMTPTAPTRTQNSPVKGRSQSAIPSLVSEPAGTVKVTGQRTSTRNIRPPGKFSEAVIMTTTHRGSGTKPTPSNQRAGMTPQQQRPTEHFPKRGPGRPAAIKLVPISPPSVVPMKRGPGRPPRNPLSPKLTPQTANSNHTEPGPTPRKRRTSSLNQNSQPSQTPGQHQSTSSNVSASASSSQGQGTTRSKTSTTEPYKPLRPPKPRTPLDKARQAKVNEWEAKLHGVIDHHDSLARELYHLETYTTTLTYDPVKIKSDHSERMLKASQAFLRNFDLWSQVPDLVSNVQLNTDRISTRRSAIEHREQLVDMLQKNVEEALPRRGDGSLSLDTIRMRTQKGYLTQFQSFEDYLNSFVYADDEEVTPEEADRRAESHAQLLNRIDCLKAEGRLGGKLAKPFVDPEVPKLHYNWLMEHIMTSSRLIKEEGKLQMARARKVSKLITRHFEQLHGKSEREQRLEEKRLRKLAKLTANEVKKKWRYVEGVVKARHRALIQEEQEEAGKRHLNLILEHSTQILGVQQSAFNISMPRQLSDPLGLADVLSGLPSPLSAADPTSRRSSVPLSVVSSDAELDAGDGEFTVAEADVDDETTLANEESGTEDDEAEISGLAAEMDIPIEELLKQYGYRLSEDEESDEDDEQAGDDENADERSQPGSSKDPIGKNEIVPAVAEKPHVKVEMNIETESGSALEDTHPDASMDMEVDSAANGVNGSNDASELDELPNTVPNPRQSMEKEEERPMSSKDIAKALPESLKSVTRPSPVSERTYVPKRRRLSLSGLYRGPPLPWNPYGEVDDERTMEEEEQEDLSDPEELAGLIVEKDMSIEDLLNRYAYEAESSEYSDSYYDSDSEYEDTIMSSLQRAKPSDPRYVVTLQDVARSRKFPTRPSSEVSDTDTEYDDNRTISIYGTDDELCLGDMLPLLDPEVPPKSPEIDTFTTGANVKTKIPFLLRHQLREYQHVGMDWLANLYSNGLNGILADEMGLGKTMQTIALLAHLACEHGIWGPHLIVVPTSVMLNWEMEFKKWCPGFKIMTYYGSPRERKEKRVGWSRENSFHVCITSYQLVVQDQAVFRRKAWQYLILDEAHNIKNFRSQRWQTLLNFNSARRLLLTGTPLQNNLMELWSLLYFLMPNGVSQTMPVGFANQKEFQEWFSHPVDRMIEGNDQQDEDSKAAIARLHTVLRPYLLRRLKSDVETQMPAKYEHIVYCRLSKRQRFLYDDFMSRAKTRETLASGNFLSIINCLMQLRKVCNHPDLFEVRPIVTSFAMPSATASFEITEFLVRRRIFSEVDKAQESVNLGFLGLIFTTAEERLSKMDLESYEELNAASCFQKKAAEFTMPQSKTLSSSNHYQDVRQYVSMRRHQLMLADRHRWEQLGYVNMNKCRTNLLYGSSLLNMCRLPIKAPIGCTTTLNQVADPQHYFEYTDAIARAIIPSEARLCQNEETIKRFAFVTPAVLVRDYSWKPIHVSPEPSSLELVCKKAEELLYPITSCLQVQFPDKRLLQFDCGKLQKLDSLLRELKSGGHRALIFTQMTKVLDILEIFLNIHGHRYLRLDGATKVENRQHLTDRFNSDPKILAFILSTRSGGVGINLTGADTVIFYDSDWNPSMDRQCQDRCHRIGQTRDVHIYRFVSEFTIEENMLKKANQKRMLDNVVIQEGEFTTDYFQKMDWRDMLGEEELAKIGDLGPTQKDGEPQDLSTVHGADLEQALAAAEDENDVMAMQQAKHEMEGVDLGDFSEVGASNTPTTASKDKHSKSRDIEGGTAKVQFAGAPLIEATEEEEIIEMGHVDEYMLRFMEREYGHYVGFGGLPEPEKNEDADDLEMLDDETKPSEDSEQEGEEEEEVEVEEENEYDIEETEESDSGEDGDPEGLLSSSEEEGDNNEGADVAAGVEAMETDD
ncbi:swr1 complex component [Gamsiella multidivaricata]|nr:swr1 complex component [Gamsiella multidivaricata]